VLLGFSVGPLTLLSPVISGIKASLVAEDEQGIMQGALTAATNLASGLCDMFFGWFYAYATAGGSIKQRSAAFPPFVLSGVLGACAFMIACFLPLQLPPPPPSRAKEQMLLKQALLNSDITGA